MKHTCTNSPIKESYITPAVELIEVVAELGFAQSTVGEDSEEVEW